MSKLLTLEVETSGLRTQRRTEENTLSFKTEFVSAGWALTGALTSATVCSYSNRSSSINHSFTASLDAQSISNNCLYLLLHFIQKTFPNCFAFITPTLCFLWPFSLPLRHVNCVLVLLWSCYYPFIYVYNLTLNLINKKNLPSKCYFQSIFIFEESSNN